MGVDLIGALKATVIRLTNNTGLSVCILDGSGNQVTSFGGSGGTASSFASALPASGTAAGANKTSDGTMQPLQVDDSGNLKIAGSFSATPTKNTTNALSTVAENAGSVTLLASNASRQGGTIYNGSDAILYVKFGATATLASFIKPILPGELWNFFADTFYTGRIDGIWASAPGTSLAAALVNELSA